MIQTNLELLKLDKDGLMETHSERPFLMVKLPQPTTFHLTQISLPVLNHQLNQDGDLPLLFTKLDKVGLMEIHSEKLSLIPKSQRNQNLQQLLKVVSKLSELSLENHNHSEKLLPMLRLLQTTQNSQKIGPLELQLVKSQDLALHTEDTTDSECF